MLFKTSTTMATFKYVYFEHHKKEDGSINVKIRVTHNRKSIFLPTSVYLWKDDLTRSFNIKNSETTEVLNGLVKDYYDDVKKIANPENLDVDCLISKIKALRKRPLGDVSFYSHVDGMVKIMASRGQKRTSDNYRFMVNSLKRFYGQSLYFSNIDVDFLQRYELWLREEKKGIKTTGERGISLYMGLIRAVFNDAIGTYNRYEDGIMVIKGSPFGKQRYQVPKEPKYDKRNYPVQVIRAIRDSKVEGQRAEQSRDLFMLSFYLMGMNAVDMYKADAKILNGRIEYHRSKTEKRRDDGAFFSVLIPPEAFPLIEKYRDPSGKRLFRFYKQYSGDNNFNRALREGLLQLEKDKKINPTDEEGKLLNELIHLEFYGARHSWATIGRNEVGLDKYTVHEGLNHVDEDTKVTDGYIGKDWKPLDKANRKVLDHLKDASLTQKAQ